MEWLYFIITSIVTWMGGFLLHEYFHKWEAQKQGIEAHILIKFDKGIPYFICIPEAALPNRGRFLLIGGLGSGITLMLLAIIAYTQWYLFVPLFTVGGINLVYCLYEKRFKDNLSLSTYLRYRLYIYAISGIICLYISTLLLTGTIPFVF